MREGWRVKQRLGREPPGDGSAADWINQQGHAWREEVIRDEISDDDSEAVLNVTIPIIQRGYILLWTHTGNGRVSVKSAYQSIHRGTRPNSISQRNNQASSPDTLWKAIWAAKV